ncbi:MAG: hypothetical protein AB4058_05480 [Microcystaceae cyanobacterium]
MRENRLDRLERIMEGTLTNMVASFEQVQERFEQQQSSMEALSQNQQQQQSSMEALTQTQQIILENQRVLLEAQTSLTTTVDQLGQTVDHLTEIQAETSEKLASIGAAVERLYALCYYLIRKEE